MEVSPITRRAGELCLDVIRDAAPDSNPTIAFSYDHRTDFTVATFTATIGGKRISVEDRFGPDEWEGIDGGEFLALTFWLTTSSAWGLSLAPAKLLSGNVPRSLRPAPMK